MTEAERVTAMFHPRLFTYRFRTPKGTVFSLLVWGTLATQADTDKRAGIIAAHCRPVK